MKSPKQDTTYLAVARVSIDPRFRSDHPSDTRPPDGVHHGWYYWHRYPGGIDYRVFVDTSGWLWGQDCKIRLMKLSKLPAPRCRVRKGELSSTPQRWEREAKKIGFTP